MSLTVLPRQDLEGRGVGARDHVGLVHPGEALDGRTVEADALREGALQLGGGHRDRLQEAEHVGEPQAHEADVAPLEGAEDELLLTCRNGCGTAPRWAALSRSSRGRRRR